MLHNPNIETRTVRRMPYETGEARARVAGQLGLAADYRRRGMKALARKYASLARMNNSFMIVGRAQ